MSSKKFFIILFLLVVGSFGHASTCNDSIRTDFLEPNTIIRLLEINQKITELENERARSGTAPLSEAETTRLKIEKGLSELNKWELKSFLENEILMDLYRLKIEKWTLYSNAILDHFVPPFMTRKDALKELVRVQMITEAPLEPHSGKLVLGTDLLRTGKWSEDWDGTSKESFKMEMTLASMGISKIDLRDIQLSSDPSKTINEKIQQILKGAGFTSKQIRYIQLEYVGFDVSPGRFKCCLGGCVVCPWNYPLHKENKKRKDAKK